MRRSTDGSGPATVVWFSWVRIRVPCSCRIPSGKPSGSSPASRVKIRSASGRCWIETPMDLSAGERQKAALALALSRRPDVLLLDEPTRGLDPEMRDCLRTTLRKQADAGMAILLVTHDVTFAAEAADRCSLLFDGEIVSSAAPRLFFPGNRFYTTPANRMTRDLSDGIVTVGDLLTALGVGQ